MQETPQYPQVTPEQIQLWEADPVTQVYLQCLGWFKGDVADDASTGTIVDSSSADLTHAMIHKNLGQQQGLSSALDYPFLFDRFNMIFEEKKDTKREYEADIHSASEGFPE